MYTKTKIKKPGGGKKKTSEEVDKPSSKGNATSEGQGLG
jgi:hypothetical protein